jgi:internalin A
MTENKHFPKKIENLELALHKTRNLLSITDKILASKTLADIDDTWLDELIAWADENNIPEEDLPRYKRAILALTMLGLDNNQLTEIPESVGKLTNLTTLDLSFNQLTEIPESVGKLTNLTTLDLGNQLTEIPDFIGELTNLEKLYLSDNQLTEIPESVGKLTNLTTLHLSFNQ